MADVVEGPPQECGHIGWALWSSKYTWWCGWCGYVFINPDLIPISKAKKGDIVEFAD